MPRRKMKKRVFGQVYRKRGNPKWYAKCPDLTRPREGNGRRHYLVRAFETKKSAEMFLAKMREAFETGVYKPRPKDAPKFTTLLDAIDKFLDAKVGQGKSKSTLVEYRRTRRRVEESGIGKRDVRTIDGEDIERFVAWRQEPGPTGKVPSSATIKKELAVLVGTLNRLIRLGVLLRNPASGVGPRTQTTRSRVTLSKEEAIRVVAACSERLRPVVQTALLTGARRGEVLNLKWQDIDLDGGFLHVFRTKTGKADRLPLNPSLVDVLREHRDRVSRANGKTIVGTDLVFPSPRGKPNWQIDRDWKAAVKDAGLSDREGLTFHSLRHSFATHFLDDSAAITDLQGILGHASLATTQIHVKMVDKRARESISRMDLGVQSGEDGE